MLNTFTLVVMERMYEKFKSTYNVKNTTIYKRYRSTKEGRSVFQSSVIGGSQNLWLFIVHPNGLPLPFKQKKYLQWINRKGLILKGSITDGCVINIFETPHPLLSEQSNPDSTNLYVTVLLNSTDFSTSIIVFKK